MRTKAWLPPCAVLLFWFLIAPRLPQAVIEAYHTWYQRFLPGPLWVTSALPFSLGDVLYLIALLWLLRTAALLLLRRQRWRLSKLLWGLALISSVFYLCWGLNYFRRPLYERLGFKRQRETPTQALALYDYLLRQAKHRRSQIHTFHYKATEGAAINEMVQAGYERLPQRLREQRVPLFVKPSLYSTLLSYSGISGYYNPFTFEAQVDANIPTVQLPFTLCHEAAHQYGVAPEDEANFYAYQAARHAPDIEFQYAAYFEALRYSLAHLLRHYPKQGRARLAALPPAIRSDFRRVRAFYQKYRNGTYALTDFLNDKYLKTNRQKRGGASYEHFYQLLLADYTRKRTP